MKQRIIAHSYFLKYASGSNAYTYTTAKYGWIAFEF